MLSHRLMLIACLLTITAAAYGQAEEHTGTWRAGIEISRESRSAKGDRDGDSFVAGSIEYEWPIFDRAAVGVLARPLFIYFQDEGSETIYGTSAGVTARMYGQKYTRSGPFLEVGCSALWHSRSFNENGARVNLWSEAGAGYQFASSPWYMALKWHHMSNAGLHGDNAGIDGFTISAGYRF